MVASTEINLMVNGKSVKAIVPCHHTLLKFLRDNLGSTGAKEACGDGDCGACVLLMDGCPVNSCLVLAVEADGHDILTVEGLAKNGELHPLQQAFLAHEAYQCGFCTSGMLMTAYALLQENPQPTPEEVKFALAGNLCRCTGYERIVTAIVSTGEKNND